MAHFYSNENFPLPVVDELRNRGHNVLTIQETGKANQAMADEEVLSFAFQHDRILLTLNRKHFLRLHKKTLWSLQIVVLMRVTDYILLAGSSNPRLTPLFCSLLLFLLG
jgi:hypothetical protein